MCSRAGMPIDVHVPRAGDLPELCGCGCRRNGCRKRPPASTPSVGHAGCGRLVNPYVPPGWMSSIACAGTVLGCRGERDHLARWAFAMEAGSWTATGRAIGDKIMDTVLESRGTV